MKQHTLIISFSKASISQTVKPTSWLLHKIYKYKQMYECSFLLLYLKYLALFLKERFSACPLCIYLKEEDVSFILSSPILQFPPYSFFFFFPHHVSFLFFLSYSCFSNVWLYLDESFVWICQVYQSDGLTVVCLVELLPWRNHSCQ